MYIPFPAKEYPKSRGVPPSRRYFLPFPIPTPAPTLRPHVPYDLAQPFRRKLPTKQLLPPDIAPKVLAKSRLHCPWMQTNGYSFLPGALFEMDIKGLDDLVHRSFGSAVGVPASQGVVGDGAYARGHEGHDCLCGKVRGGE